MCGICGKVNFDPGRQVPRALLHAMTRSIAHRGPDGEGHFFDGPAGLGHRRLGIIDLETGAQPMTNEDGSVWVVFNGEIYNFVELRRELIACGHRFRTASDTEVIVHLYEDLGERCVERLQGMFAFAVWDVRRQRLLLARDRVGIKPLYYAETADALVFGSEIKALLVDPALPRRVDVAAIDSFLSHGYGPGASTPIAGVKKLLPGHWLALEAGRITSGCYWDLAFTTPAAAPTLEASAEQLRRLLDETVERHMISDVPVGVLLSGGVDSSGILHHAARHASGPLHTFTMGFAAANLADERPYARLAAEQSGALHHEVTLDAAGFRDALPAYAWHMEEPVCEPPAIALHRLAQAARERGIKVLLSGEGGDEAFAGYPEYHHLVALERLKAGGSPVRIATATGLGLLSALGWQRADHYRALLGLRFDDYYFSRTSTPSSLFNRLRELRGPALAAVPSNDADRWTRRLSERTAGWPLLNRMLYVDTKSWLPDDLLVKADKMTMAASVELRVPLLDHRLLEFAAALPLHHKARGRAQKRVLRQALATAVPTAILNRPKAGFPVPYGAWLRNELRDQVHDTLLARDSFCRAYLEPSAVGRLLAEHRAGRRCDKEVFSLLALELWYARFITGYSASDRGFAPAAPPPAAAADERPPDAAPRAAPSAIEASVP